MKVLGLYQAPVRAAFAYETLSDVASRMAFYEIGAIAVTENGKLVGIITERDIVRAIADEVDIQNTRIETYMTREPVWVTPEDDVRKAFGVMLAIGARHLPVVESGQTVGMLSVRDLLAAETAILAEYRGV